MPQRKYLAFIVYLEANILASELTVATTIYRH